MRSRQPDAGADSQSPDGLTADAKAVVELPDAPVGDIEPDRQLSDASAGDGNGEPPVSDAAPAEANDGGRTADAALADAGVEPHPVDGRGQDASTCTQPACLGGHKYLYQSNRIWKPAAGSAVRPWEPLVESDYQPSSDGPSFVLSFSPDGGDVVVVEVDARALEDAAGTLAQVNDTFAVYDLENNWAGARLVMFFVPELGAEVTIFGSGVPIVESTRGTVSSSTAYEAAGETCPLPVTLPYDQYLPMTYGDALANAGLSPVTCAGIRNGYCGGTCTGWLVAIIAWRDVPTAAAYDPVTRALVGWKSGAETYGVCHGIFPPLASDGSPGWDLAKMDRASACP